MGWSLQVRGLTGGGSLTSAKVPEELDHVAHVPQAARTVDVLVSGTVDGVDRAEAQLQPLTITVYHVPIMIYGHSPLLVPFTIDQLPVPSTFYRFVCHR